MIPDLVILTPVDPKVKPPPDFVSVLVHIPSMAPLPQTKEAYLVGGKNGFWFTLYEKFSYDAVEWWAEMPE